MSCLRRICGNRSWGPDSTRYAEIRRQCQMPSIWSLISYHRLRWLGKACKMTDDRLPLKTLFRRIGGCAPRGRPPKTWIECVREDLVQFSKLHGVFGTYMNWWLECKDSKAWKIAIHKLKQTNSTCRTGAVRAAVHWVWSIKCLIINRFGGARETDRWYRLGGRYCPEVSGHVLTCTCPNCTWREALNGSVWIDFHVYISGLGLIHLAILRWSRCTPSLWTGNV